MVRVVAEVGSIVVGVEGFVLFCCGISTPVHFDVAVSSPDGRE